MLNFENTKVAFKLKSNLDLNRAYWLFRVIGSPFIVKLGKAITLAALKLRLPINFIVKRTIFKQFCGGENIEECSETITALGAHGIGTILDYSVEGKTEDDDFERTTQIIIDTIIKADSQREIPFAVFKITGISDFGLLEKANNIDEIIRAEDQIKLDQIKERINRICSIACEKGVPVFIDAEESWIQDIIDIWAFEMMLKFNTSKTIVYNTIQMYRHDRFEFLKKCREQASKNGITYGVKLVRGAYMEKERARALEKGYPSPIQKDKAATDTDYNKAQDYILKHLSDFALVAGTHNESSSLMLSEALKNHNIGNDDPRVYFAQLLGMSDHISFNLANEGFNVAKYVPFGPVKEVMPYLLRRADENTSVAGQTGRELGLILTEKKRRRSRA